MRLWTQLSLHVLIFCVVGRQLNAATGDVYEMFFMFSSLFVIIRHYNFVLICESFNLEPNLQPFLCFKLLFQPFSPLHLRANNSSNNTAKIQI